MWRKLPRCKPQAQAAYFRDFNRGKDQFGREVLNPAGVDLTPRRRPQHGPEESTRTTWVRVHFPWVQTVAEGRPLYASRCSRIRRGLRP